MVRLFIDSGTDRSGWLEEHYDYGFLPLTVILGEEEYIDDEEIKLNQVYDYMKEGNFPKTAQLTPQRAKEAFEECAKNGEDIIHIALHKGLSGTYQAAYTALEEVKEDYPDFKGAIVNSKGAASGPAIMFVQAAELLNADYSYEEVVEQLEWLSDHIHYHIFADDLNWLAKGGRLPKSIGLVGSALKVKAYLGLDEEGVVKRGILRGRERAYRQIIQNVVEGVGDFKSQLICISYVGDFDQIEPIVEGISEKIPEAKIELFELGPILATHLGLGGLGVMYVDEKPEHYILPKN